MPPRPSPTSPAPVVVAAPRSAASAAGANGQGAAAFPTRSITGEDKQRLLSTEWLLSNGLGGFAMGTASGVLARRYHGLLVAATRPPVGRIMALNALVETLEINPGTAQARTVDLAMFRFGATNPVLHPHGDRYLTGFEHDLSARWAWEVPVGEERVRITKEVYLFERANTVGVRYTMSRSAAGKTSPIHAQLRLRPMVSLRDVHGLIRRSWMDRFETDGRSPGMDRCRVSLDGRNLYIAADSASFSTDVQWWNQFYYTMDAERGEDCVEDLYSPGFFRLDMQPGESAAKATINASLNDEPMRELDVDLVARRARLGTLVTEATRSAKSASAGDRATIASLTAAADQFVVGRAERSAPDPTALPALVEVSTIAGYPWFSDWGRDTFVSLPGLMLATGRFDDAHRTLLAFASHRRRGLIPNVFDDRTGHPEYNNVDGSLWFIHAACRYLEASGDRTTFDNELLPACLDVVAAYRRGTDFNIAMDPLDKLITAGTHGSQLTWMDAKRNGIVFTPRYGKPVEVNALWFSGLRSLSEAVRPKDATVSANLNDLAEAVGKSFRRRYWNEAGKCLFDCLTPNDDGKGEGGWAPVAEIRPNQIFAVSLPHSALSIEEQRAVVASVKGVLFTPMGLRTLDPADPKYWPRYQGNLFERDRAYHNGTAWPWLLGPYAEAILRTGSFSAEARAEARAAITPMLGELGAPRGGCLGQLAEVYDGSEPQRAQGCTAQAWSVAEMLRVMLMLA